MRNRTGRPLLTLLAAYMLLLTLPYGRTFILDLPVAALSDEAQPDAGCPAETGAETENNSEESSQRKAKQSTETEFVPVNNATAFSHFSPAGNDIPAHAFFEVKSVNSPGISEPPPDAPRG